MDNQNQDSIFELTLSEEIKIHLIETAKWSKFLAIIGFIIGAFVVFAGFAIMLIGGSIFGAGMGSSAGSLGTILGLVYILLGLVYVYPSIKLLRFSGGMPDGLNKSDQQMVNTAFANLKSVFKFYGILTIVIIGLYLLAMVLVSIFGAFY